MITRFFNMINVFLFSASSICFHSLSVLSELSTLVILMPTRFIIIVMYINNTTPTPTTTTTATTPAPAPAPAPATTTTNNNYYNDIFSNNRNNSNNIYI